MFSFPVTTFTNVRLSAKYNIYNEKLNGRFYPTCYGLGFILELSIIHIEAKRKFLTCCKICLSSKRQRQTDFKTSFK